MTLPREEPPSQEERSILLERRSLRGGLAGRSRKVAPVPDPPRSGATAAAAAGGDGLWYEVTEGVAPTISATPGATHAWLDLSDVG